MRLVRGVGLSAGFLALLFGCWAQAPTAPPVPASQVAPAAPPATPPSPPTVLQNPSGGHFLTADDLETFFDGILPLQLERGDIAGAAVLVMKDGNVLLEKGYGYADVKTKKPVDPKTTLFRPGSISKLFTWVAVMQLVEQGRLNLDTDVNHYLDFQIRPAFDKPITLRNLMTHTGGFEEVSNDIVNTDPRKVSSLRDTLIRNQPARLFPPGEVPAYSNYGVALASYIVQRAAGERFEQYVDEHIFAPLGMTHSSFYQPLEKRLEYSDSLGYGNDTTKPPVGFEIVALVGAGGLSASADDMGRFGQAMLNGGELDGNRILKPETVAQMWTPQFRVSDQLPPICMGFYQAWRNNLRWVGHGGDLIAFHSMFFIEPHENLVLFVSYNSSGGANQPRPEIVDSFSDRYFPGESGTAFLTTAPKDLKEIEGTYLTTRRADSTRMRIANLFDQRRVSVDKDGVLTLEGRRNLRGHIMRYRPIGKDLWQAEGEQDRLFAIRDGRNRIVRIAMNFPGAQMETVPWYENAKLVVPAMWISLVICALVTLAALLRAGRRLFMRRRPKLMPQPGTIWLTLAPRSAAAVWALLVGSIVGFFVVRGNDFMFTPAWFPWFVAINWVTGLALLLSLFAVISAIRIWWRPHIRRSTMLKFTLVGAACLILSLLSVYYHLIGPANRI